MASLSERFGAVTSEKTKVSFLKMSYHQLANQRIAFGEAKLNHKFKDVTEQDPKYTAWFVKKYEGSQKQAHQVFLHFSRLYTERLEMTLESDPLSRPSTLELRAKSKAMHPEVPGDKSPHSWTDEEVESKPWSVLHEEASAMMKEEMIQQNGHRKCRERLAADLTTTPSPDPSDDDAGRCTETVSESNHGHDLRSWICDAVGSHMLSQPGHDVMDVNYFDSVKDQHQGRQNWV